ncbi:general transcription factor 3C polypeptide 3 isoform X2 [Anabrus simplex]|uniref:general transcription factor 3C polypeptide 3 isoform X2 n=1 Tax=Anabrus simplex TaxID=316456 RepID=UPI0035A35046
MSSQENPGNSNPNSSSVMDMEIVVDELDPDSLPVAEENATYTYLGGPSMVFENESGKAQEDSGREDYLDSEEEEEGEEEYMCWENDPNELIGLIPKEKEVELTNRFLEGELTFSEYAAMMEGNEVEENNTESPYIVSSAAVDAFERDLVAATKRKGKGSNKSDDFVWRRRRNALPPVLRGLMGEANLSYIRGDRDTAIKLCLEVIRQQPTASEPFSTLAVLYEEMGAADKAMQFALIAAHLSPQEPQQWIRLAESSEKQGNLKQAITCYSKAIIADPSDVNTHIKRCCLLDDLGDKKASLRGYVKLLSILPPEDSSTIINISRNVAQRYHEDGELGKAREALEVAFNKCSQLITSEMVNLMLELVIGLQDYTSGLNYMIQYCSIEVEAVSDENESNGNDEPTLKILSCNIPNTLPADLQAKFVILMVHMKAFHLVDGLITFLLENLNPELYGDLFLDVAEALMKEKKFQDALRLLNPLVRSANYSLAAVWLRQGECLKECKNLEEACEAYETVVSLAPQHLEARVMLSSLYRELGDVEKAIGVLTQDAESDVLHPSLLYKRCMLLKEAGGKAEEFLAVGQLLLSRHCTRIRNRDELHALTRLRRLGKKSEALKEVRAYRGESELDHDGPDFEVGQNEPTVEEEWQLFLDLCKTCYDLKQFPLLQRLSFSALGSKKFHVAEKVQEIEFICLLACFYNGDAYYGYNFARDHILKHMNWPRIWNFFNLVIQRADDVRHNRFIMRLLARSTDHKALTLLHANNCLVAGTYKYALSEYATFFKENPCAPVAFLIGVTLFQMACQKFSAKKHSLVTQGLSFLWQYKKLRGEMGEQECDYNLGRAFHQLGLLPAAIHHYKLCLNFSSPLTEQYPQILDLKREAAFNLHLIYLHSGAPDIARSYIEKYIVI